MSEEKKTIGIMGEIIRTCCDGMIEGLLPDAVQSLREDLSRSLVEGITRAVHGETEEELKAGLVADFARCVLGEDKQAFAGTSDGYLTIHEITYAPTEES